MCRDKKVEFCPSTRFTVQGLANEQGPREGGTQGAGYFSPAVVDAHGVRFPDGPPFSFGFLGLTRVTAHRRSGLFVSPNFIFIMNFRIGQFVSFAGYRCRVVSTFDGKGTPAPSDVTLRVAQRWYQWPSPPIEYVVREDRWSEITLSK